MYYCLKKGKKTLFCNVFYLQMRKEKFWASSATPSDLRALYLDDFRNGETPGMDNSPPFSFSFSGEVTTLRGWKRG